MPETGPVRERASRAGTRDGEPELRADGRADRPAWYAARPGAWRDWVTVLHPPYTAWHLSYVLVGAGLADQFHLGRLLATLGAFALAVGIGAHGLDELKGRPLGTRISSVSLLSASIGAITGAVVLGALGITVVGWGLAVFMAVGVILVVGYNGEFWDGFLHNDRVFALAWGSFPLLTAYFAQASTIRVSAIVASFFAYELSRAQRALSSEARELRRRVQRVEGVRYYRDGTTQQVGVPSLLRPLEQGLIALSWAACALGTALVVAKAGY